MPTTFTPQRYPRAGAKDNLIIQSLLELYKEKGIDLHVIMDDPTFLALPVSVKADLLKKYASHISSNTSSVLSKSDIKSLIVNASLGAAIAGGFTALSSYTFNTAIGRDPHSYSPTAMAVGIGAGALAGGIRSLTNSAKRISDRNDVSRRLSGLVTSQSEKDAMKILALRNIQTGKVSLPASPLSELTHKATNMLNPLAAYIGSNSARKNALVSNGNELEANPEMYSGSAEGDRLEALDMHAINKYTSTKSEADNAILNKIKGMF